VTRVATRNTHYYDIATTQLIWVMSIGLFSVVHPARGGPPGNLDKSPAVQSIGECGV